MKKSTDTVLNPKLLKGEVEDISFCIDIQMFLVILKWFKIMPLQPADHLTICYHKLFFKVLRKHALHIFPSSTR